MLNFLAYADGSRDLVMIADQIGVDAWECAAIAKRLSDSDVIRVKDD